VPAPGRRPAKLRLLQRRCCPVSFCRFLRMGLAII
jgi:hypothetical protein